MPIPAGKNLSKMNDYPEVVKQIHNEFNNAGEKLLQESLTIIGDSDINKSKRLNNVGFKNVVEMKKIETPAQMAALVMKYRAQFPTHKFISKTDVSRICHKYKLVKGNTEQFTGFVPDKNLKEIETFSEAYKVNKRLYVNSIKFQFRHQSKLHEEVKSKLSSNGNLITSDEIAKFFIYRNGIKHAIEHDYLGVYVGISDLKTTDLPPFDICAPKKDMISDEKFKALKGLFELSISVAPDPVVLYPVEHGYIIVTAWGDEASDPLVANEQMN